MGWLSKIFGSSSSKRSDGKSRKGKRGRRSTENPAETGEGLEQDSVAAGEARPLEGSVTLETAEGNEESPEPMGPGDAGSSDEEVRPPRDETAGDRSADSSRVETAEGNGEARPPAEPAEFRASIETGLKRVQGALQQRGEAQVLRGRCQSVFAQSESILEEAIRSVESAGKAYEDGFAANSGANMEATVKVRKMAEDLRSQKENDRSAYQGVLGQAFEMAESTTQALTAALESLDSAVMSVARELEESTKAASTADSAKESAMRQLLAVQIMWNDLASMREDLLARPDPASAAPAHPEPAPQPVPQAGLEEPYVLLKELNADGASLLAPGLTGQEIEDQVLDAAGSEARKGVQPAAAGVGPAVEPLTGDPALDLEIANAAAAANFPGTAGASAAEALRREMAGLAPLPDDSVASIQVPDLAAAEQKAPAVSASEPQAVTPAVPEPELALEPEQSAPVASSAPAPALAKSYSGRVYMMFDASVNQETLAFVWDAVEEAAGRGVIVDTRLVSQEEGVQLTLDLADAPLDIEAFLQRLPGAELSPLAEDRIKVVWTPAMQRA